jgi:FtsZ-interacting cell division protein ZipA
MDTWVWIVIAVVVVAIVLGVIWAALRTRRSRGLQERFGSEYDRVAADAPTKRAAESELREREQRREEFDIKPLDPDQRESFRAQWVSVQADFVDDPAGSLAAADSLIQTVMRMRGYPVDDFDTRSGDLSVDHPDVVENYRAGHGIAVAHERGKAGTEELRKAVQHYRALFDELVGAEDTADSRS